MQTALYYCESKVAEPGSDWYYGLLKLNANLREMILALLTLDLAWHETLHCSHEPDIVQRKFAFWQEELQNTFIYQKPTHPATQLLAKHLALYPICLEDLQTHLNIYQAQMYSPYIDKSKHILILIANKVLSKNDLPGAYLQCLDKELLILDSVLHLREELQKGMLPFTKETLTQYAIDEADLFALKKTPALEHLLADYASEAKTCFTQLLSLLSKSQRQQQKPILKWIKLRLALLQLYQADHFSLFTHKIQLTPIRKLVMTWWYCI